MSGRLLPMIDPESKDPSRSDYASPATYGIKGFGAKAGESGINGFKGLHLLYHWANCLFNRPEESSLVPAGFLTAQFLQET